MDVEKSNAGQDQWLSLTVSLVDMQGKVRGVEQRNTDSAKCIKPLPRRLKKKSGDRWYGKWR